MVHAILTHMCAVAVNTGIVPIYSYGIMMALAFLAGVGICTWLVRRDGQTSAFASDLGCWIMVAGIIGARIAYVLANPNEYIANPIAVLYIHEGGLVYYGGLVGAIFGIAFFARARRFPVLRLYDTVAVAVPVSHAIGRVGCFLNGCCFGRIHDGLLSIRYPLDSPAGWSHYHAGLVSNPYVQDLMRQLSYRQISAEHFRAGLADLVSRGLADEHAVRSMPVHPVQIYESGLNLALFALLLWLFRRPARDGAVALVYLAGYALIRFATEFARGDPRLMVGKLTVAQAASLGLLLAVAVLFKIGARSADREVHNTS